MPATATTARPASDKQLAFIDRLMQEKLDEEQRRATYKRLSDGISSREASAWIDKLMAMPTINVTPGNAMSDKQRAFAMTLATERLDGDDLDAILARLDDTTVGITKRDASALIDQLLALPKPVPVAVNLPAVPQGRYAVESADGVLTFYHVRINSGKVTIKLQHGPATTVVPFTSAGYATILQSILDAGIEQAMKRYGHELGHCGNCGLALTDEDSRALGIGPVCRQNLGW